jgi:hypothetical protein
LHDFHDRQTVKLANTPVDEPTDRDRNLRANFTAIARSACATRRARSTVRAHGVRRLEIGDGSLSDVWLRVDSSIGDAPVGTSDPLDHLVRSVSLSRVPLARLAPGCCHHSADARTDARARDAAARALLAPPLSTHRLSRHTRHRALARPFPR